jgi:ankyrin repeat domain-containing protein 50
MAEIGLILNIASLLKLSNTVLTNCWDYVVKVRNAPKDINKIINEVSGLESLLKQLSSLASSPENDPRLASLKALYALPTGPFQACTETLADAAKKLEKIAIGNVVKRRLLWPFEGDKLQELLDRLEKHKATFMLALAGDSLEIQMETNQRIQGIETQLDDWEIHQERNQISLWLSGADPSMNHNLGRKRCEPGTGEWLFDTNEFKEWKDGRGGILWLHGIPGAGKTVLSSTLIERLKANSKGQPVRIAFYYFDFSDREKQTTEACVRSLVKQLFDQSTAVSEELRSVYENVSPRRPTVEALAEVLRGMLNDAHQDFIVIDALDECAEQEEEREREAFFEVWREVKCMCDGAYNIFIASRREPDIQRELSDMGAIEVTMERSLVDHDIRSHIGALLLREPRFKKWPETIRTEIERVLIGQSNGM